MITLPTTPAILRQQVIVPALAELPPKMRTLRAEVMLLAIAQQESGLAARVQAGDGPARGLWQFELGATAQSGVRGVVNHAASAGWLKDYCAAHDIPFDAAVIHARLETDDALACVVARLLLWTDPAPLPALWDCDGAWLTYLHNWRPGKPRQTSWQRYHMQALEVYP